MPAKKEDAKKAQETPEAKEKKESTKKVQESAEAVEKKEKAEKKPAEKKEKKTKASSGGNVDKVIEMVESMSVLELSDLVKSLEERFGVTAAAPIPFMPGAVPGAAAAPEVEEKTEFDVILKDIGDQKIQVIKVVRAITGLGLIEAKKLVEEFPKPIKEAVNKEEAEEIRKKVEEVGATVEIR